MGCVVIRDLSAEPDRLPATHLQYFHNVDAVPAYPPVPIGESADDSNRGDQQDRSRRQPPSSRAFHLFHTGLPVLDVGGVASDPILSQTQNTKKRCGGRTGGRRLLLGDHI